MDDTKNRFSGRGGRRQPDAATNKLPHAEVSTKLYTALSARFFFVKKLDKTPLRITLIPTRCSTEMPSLPVRTAVGVCHSCNGVDAFK